MFSILFLAALFASPALGDWNYSTGKDFKPCAGKLSDKPSASVSDEVYTRLVVNKGYVDRLNTLAAQNDPDIWKFNFNPQIASASSYASYGAGGVAVLATRGTAPSLIDTGVAMALGFLEPCGLNTPHYHPFATQLSAVVSGGPIQVGAIWYTYAGKEQMSNTVNTWEMVTLPQGSIHWEFNDSCEPAVTANAFGTDDPGILNVANAFFSLNTEIVNATLGFPAELNGYRVGEFADFIPPSYAFGVQACLDRCGINRASQGTPPSRT